MKLIPEIASYITRLDGKKFLRLDAAPNQGNIIRNISRNSEKLPLYAHIPFCRTLCPFCCFNRYLFQEEKARKYFISLKKELELYYNHGFTFSELYIGGGTPTILMDELISFIQYVKEKFDVNNISLETTPYELTEQNVQQLQSSGVKRLSVGVQSFNDDHLKAMGRILCMGQETRERLLKAQNRFDTVNIDLLFNFPFQTLETFANDIKIFKSLGLDQVTFYPLMPSPHKKNAMERKFARVDTTREKNFYELILKEFNDCNYSPSTVWCFSRGDHIIDEYIVDYADYIGIGSGSVSLAKGKFYINSFSLEKYSEMIDADHLPVVRFRDLSRREYCRYYLLTRLFGMQIDQKQFTRHFATDISRELGLELRLLKIAGVITRQDDKFLVTPGGMYTISAMMREFFASLNNLREYCIEKQV